MEETETNNMKERKPKNIFVEGPIAATFIADSIEKHKSKTGIGGHSIFLGQVRADKIEGKEVSCSFFRHLGPEFFGPGCHRRR